ncbi:protein FAR1-RELATED SEQUENCE 5-like [Medicago truncatula]|uniref:protein FAR1-RELATED SEQUENCE 5-like n=1 Tax=Medicago truncatula TaxID=3880 RepID=UPI00196802A4|nr:protein FAR1-RELATED SEQUENCE 5-like [Medicago truncatula]
MDVLVDASIDKQPDIVPSSVLPVVSLEVLDDPENAKVREKARKLGFTIVIGKSDKDDNGRSAFVTVICEIGGSYREYKRKTRCKIAGSVKCECTFRLRGYLLIAGECDLSIKVGYGTHNHDMADVLKGHKTVGSLNPNERVHLYEMAEPKVPPRQMLTNLRKRNKHTSTTIKHVYNATHRYRIRGLRTDMQHLLKSLVENEYVYTCRNYRDFDYISDIFWAHPNGIKLFNTFSTGLVLDSTYNTNKYRLPLLEFVANTFTQLIFSIGFTYMMYEKEEHVTWALERCRKLLHSKDLYPKVVVTDHDNALMNDVDTVFPESTALLCEYHIERNVRAKCKTDCKVNDLKGKDGKVIKPNSMVKTIMRAWEDIMDSDTEKTYVDNCNRFKVVCEKWHKFVEYVESTMLGPVKYWVNQVMHMENTTTNRVESAYNRLKNYLTNIMGDLSTNWESVHDMLESVTTYSHTRFLPDEHYHA